MVHVMFLGFSVRKSNPVMIYGNRVETSVITIKLVTSHQQQPSIHGLDSYLIKYRYNNL